MSRPSVAATRRSSAGSSSRCRARPGPAATAPSPSISRPCRQLITTLAGTGGGAGAARGDVMPPLHRDGPARRPLHLPGFGDAPLHAGRQGRAVRGRGPIRAGILGRRRQRPSDERHHQHAPARHRTIPPLPLTPRNTRRDCPFGKHHCQSASQIDPLSARKFDPPAGRKGPAALAWGLCWQRGPEPCSDHTTERLRASLAPSVPIAEAQAIFAGLDGEPLRRHRFEPDGRRRTGHSAKVRLVVTMTEVRSWSMLMRWKSICPPASAKGR